MVTFKEVIKNHSISDIPLNVQQNIEELLTRINVIRKAYNKPFIITSGFRSMPEHINIYYKKGITDLNKIPMRSKHLIGCALDVHDPTGELNQWCKDNEELIRETGLWLEERQGPWQHFQSLPYGSYNLNKSIFFKP